HRLKTIPSRRRVLRRHAVFVAQRPCLVPPCGASAVCGVLVQLLGVTRGFLTRHTRLDSPLPSVALSNLIRVGAQLAHTNVHGRATVHINRVAARRRSSLRRVEVGRRDAVESSCHAPLAYRQTSRVSLRRAGAEGGASLARGV